MSFKKGAQMREIAFGRVFPNKVSWTLGRFKARAGHFQIKSLGKHQLWTQRKPPGVIIALGDGGTRECIYIT